MGQAGSDDPDGRSCSCRHGRGHADVDQGRGRRAPVRPCAPLAGLGRLPGDLAQFAVQSRTGGLDDLHPHARASRRDAGRSADDGELRHKLAHREHDPARADRSLRVVEFVVSNEDEPSFLIVEDVSKRASGAELGRFVGSGRAGRRTRLAFDRRPAYLYVLLIRSSQLAGGDVDGRARPLPSAGRSAERSHSAGRRVRRARSGCR